MPKLEILVGMIGSGKSTYAQSRANSGAFVVSHDDLTQMLHGGVYRCNQEYRGLYREIEDKIVGTLLSIKQDVVVDRTHLTRESRSRWIKFCWLAKAYLGHIDIVAVRFQIESPETHASRRYLSDSRGRSIEEWRQVANHHHNQATAEPLDESEGFDCIEDAEPWKES